MVWHYGEMNGELPKSFCGEYITLPCGYNLTRCEPSVTCKKCIAKMKKLGILNNDGRYNPLTDKGIE